MAKQVTSVVVSGTIGEFTQHEVLTDRTKIASYVRTCYNEGKTGGDFGNPTPMTDDELLAIVDEVGQSDDPEMDEMAWEEAIDNAPVTA